MSERMLVIDDEPVVLESCKKIFSDKDYEVETTSNPEEGLALLTEKNYEVVLCDLIMPGMGGVEVVSKIRELSPESAVVMITGFPSAENATAALQQGAMDFISKPFTPEELVVAVEKAQKKKLQQRVEEQKRAEGLLKTMSVPIPDMDDKAPKTIAQTVSSKVGVVKTTSPWLSVFVLGILAGAYIGFGGLLATSVTFDTAKYLGLGVSKLLSGSVFSLGLMLVIIAGAELFTGNNLMISSVITGDITFGKMLKRWGLVYLANFVGSIIVVLLFVYSGLWKTGGGALGAKAVGIAYAKVNLPFVEALMRAIGCNWIVCLAVWMALSARQTIGKIFAIFFPIMGFVAIGFEHSIANMYFIPAGIMLSAKSLPFAEGFNPAALTWLSFAWKNLLPVTIGNIIGGVVFVGVSYWGAYLKPAGNGK